MQAAVAAAVACVLLVIAVGALVVRSGDDAALVRAELAQRSERPAVRPEAERAVVAQLSRGLRRPPPVPPASPATPTARVAPASAAHPAAAQPPVGAPRERPRDLMDPFYDRMFGRDPAERPIHDWLRAVRLTRRQPGPAPPEDVLDALADVAATLDALAGQLAREVGDESAPLLEPGDRESGRELEHAQVLLLAASCAESLGASGDPARGERLLEAAWTLNGALPVGIDNAGPGDLLLAVVRQVQVDDAGAWGDRIEELAPQARLVEALEWDAASRLAHLARTAERRQQVQPGRGPAALQLFLGSIETKHDTVFTTRIAAAEATLAQQVRALDPCDDPWQLAGLDTGDMRRHWPVAAEVRLRLALASASLAQLDAALTRHVLLRRHGLEAPRATCDAQALAERHLGGGRFVVGWRMPGRDEPGVGDRERPRNYSVNWRTWPEPSLPGPSLDMFRFEAPMPAVHAPVLTTGPAP